MHHGSPMGGFYQEGDKAHWGAGMMVLRGCERKKECSLSGRLWGRSYMADSGSVHPHLIQVKGRNQYHRELGRVGEFLYEKL